MSATLTRIGCAPSIKVHRLLSVAAAGVTGVISWVGIHVGDIDLILGTGRHAQNIGAGRIALSAIAVALIGWAVLAVIERRIGPGRRALQLWRRISLGVLAVSLLGPLTVDATTSTRWWLIALHTSVAATLIPQMSRRAASSPGVQPHPGCLQTQSTERNGSGDEGGERPHCTDQADGSHQQ